MSGQGSGGNVIAAICNVFFPGLGQLVQGRILAALAFFVLIAICAATWFLVIPAIIGGILYVWCIIDAAKFKA